MSAAAGTDYFKGETIVNTADSATAYDYLMWDMPNTNDAASEDNYTFNVVRKILQVVVPALPARYMHKVMDVFVSSFDLMLPHRRLELFSAMINSMKGATVSTSTDGRTDGRTDGTRVSSSVCVRAWCRRCVFVGAASCSKGHAHTEQCRLRGVAPWGRTRRTPL